MNSLPDEDLIRLLNSGRTEADLRWLELIQEMRRAFSRLPTEFQEVLAMRELAGMSYAEMAHSLGITKAEVRARLFHARQALKEKLAPYLTPSA